MASLLTLLDGSDQTDLQDRPRVVVVATTNRPNAIDPALRRPGRFDREFEIGIPSAAARLDILTVLFRGLKHNLTASELEAIAAKTHGYVGADLALVCQEAGLLAIQRLRKLHVDIDDDRLSADDRKRRCAYPGFIIESQDVETGLGHVRPSVVREIVLEVPKVYWHEIGGQDDVKQKLKEAVEWPLKVCNGVADSASRRLCQIQHPAPQGSPAVWPSGMLQNTDGKGSGNRGWFELFGRQGTRGTAKAPDM